MLHTYHFVLAAAAVLASIPLLFGQQAEFRSLANSLAEDIAAAGKKSIAVVDFTDLKGNPTELGRYLAEELAVAMSRTRRGFAVIDRTHIKTILQEHKLTSTGLIDPATAKKLGQIVGADALLTGSMTPFSESIRVAVKVISTDTARIVAADNADLPKTKTIAELVGSSSGVAEERRPPREAYSQQSEATGVPRRVIGSKPQEPHPISRQPSSAAATQFSQEFSFDLLECRGVGGSIRCSLRVTNRGRDRGLSLKCDYSNSSRRRDSYFSRAFDNLGNESTATDCSLSNQSFENWASYIQTISGVPMQASILFSDLDPVATTLSLISIKGDVNEQSRLGKFELSFRNVPIVR